MVQKFECEHCGKVSSDVWHDEDAEMALCSKCIKTKNEWMNGEQSEAGQTHTSKGRQGDAAFRAERDNEILKFWEDGYTLPEIGAQFDLSKARIRRILKSNGVW